VTPVEPDLLFPEAATTYLSAAEEFVGEGTTGLSSSRLLPPTSIWTFFYVTIHQPEITPICIHHRTGDVATCSVVIKFIQMMVVVVGIYFIVYPNSPPLH
jgi:hypothetical protein